MRRHSRQQSRNQAGHQRCAQWPHSKYARIQRRFVEPRNVAGSSLGNNRRNKIREDDADHAAADARSAAIPSAAAAPSGLGPHLARPAHPSSRPRSAARATSKFAAFPQAISSTTPTAASSKPHQWPHRANRDIRKAFDQRSPLAQSPLALRIARILLVQASHDARPSPPALLGSSPRAAAARSCHCRLVHARIAFFCA